MIELVVKKPTVELSASMGGYSEGYDKGYKEGYYYGYEYGYADGEESGVINGYDSGYEIGYQEGYDEGNAEGLKEGHIEAYDAFWDIYQDFGTRTDYRFAFYGRGWNDDTYNPKYDIVCAPTAAFPTMFADAVFGYAEITDTKVSIDLTQATSCGSFFSECGKLVTVRKLIVAETTLMNTVFGYNPSLKNVTIEGTIGTDCVIRYSSQLTTESVDSIINALKDLTGQTAKTLTFHATVKSKLTQEQKDTIAAKNWVLA